LLDLLTEDIELLIIDNASDIPVEETLSDLIASHQNKRSVNIHRNAFNVGMSANIMKCFELSQGKYMWLLGDDDRINLNSFSTINYNIKEHPEAVFFNFATSGSGSRGKTIVTNGDNFVSKIDQFGSLIFISACVFKRNTFVNHLRYGYIFAGTLAPHFALLLVSLKPDHVCILSNQIIADNQHSDSTDNWSYMAGICSFPLLIDCLSIFTNQKLLSQKMADSLLHPLNVAIEILHYSEKQIHRKEFLSYYFKYLGAKIYSLCNIKTRLQWLFLSLCPLFPSFFLNLLISYKKKSHGHFLLKNKENYYRV